MRVVILFLGLLFVTGCSNDLIVRASDTSGAIAGKVATRALLCPLSLCFSEWGVAMQKNLEAQQAQRAEYWRWVRSLPQEEQAREYQLEQARIQANGFAMFGAGNALINGMNQGFNNRPPMSSSISHSR